MSTLVTGGAGFIGSNLVEELLAQGEEVVVLDNMHTGSTSNLEGLDGDLRVIEASCNEIPQLDLHPERIYHLGIPSSSPMYKRDPMLVGEAINGFLSVLELARSCGARVVYASSSSLYSGLEPPHSEDMEIQVTDYYTEARLAMERLAELYARLFDVKSAGLRFFSVYGPRERAKKQYANMVTQFLWDIQAGRQPIIYGDGSQTRDFIYVRDVVAALLRAMRSGWQGILNVGTGRAHSFNEAIEVLGSSLGVPVQPKYVDNPIRNYVSHTLADTSRAEEVLGFRAEYSLKDGVEELIEHYRCG
ncbi:MAG: NAD-dependent epimerase/dehydratase family protein [Methanothrix sp.]|nr:NAD-dependent epimerase/dehydratase family protein [Methanothrix sp.]